HLFPTTLNESEIHSTIRELSQGFVFNRAVNFPSQPVGKLSMGVGGINACVISRPWDLTG
ncbi:MAG TPA: hypothetical protein VFU02_17655, partial [Polyangiaceae bacterium]|nr:hypothetical protein [Polyangiaceae bacterium]